jgi:molybdopterin molybdotransferase
VREAARPIASEELPLAAAAGRILAEAVVARVDSPPATVSAMDGYAVLQADLDGGQTRFRVVGESFAGAAQVPAIAPGECLRIFTGAPLPAGADRVIIQEVVQREGDEALMAGPLSSGRHVRAQGSDFIAGDTLLPAGRTLDPRALVAAAAADSGTVPVWRRPRIAILGTGDELVEPGAAASRPGTIPESVSFGVAALAELWGGEILERLRLRDEPAVLEREAARALAASDLVVVTGGASVGERDYAKAMFAPLGLDLLFAKVAIKPGKPVWLGRAQGKLVLGLPGNPTSAMVTARLLLAPLVAGLAGRDPAQALRWRAAPLVDAIGACGDRETFWRGCWDGDAIRPLSNQDSGAQKALAAADVLIRRRAGALAAQASDRIEIIDF